jgi:hypothetical protein
MDPKSDTSAVSPGGTGVQVTLEGPAPRRPINLDTRWAPDLLEAALRSTRVQNSPGVRLGNRET